MRVSVLETETKTFKSQSQLWRLRLLEVNLSFETEPGKAPRVEIETKDMITFRDHSRPPLDVETESFVDRCYQAQLVLQFLLQL